MDILSCIGWVEGCMLLLFNKLVLMKQYAINLDENDPLFDCPQGKSRN